MTRHALDFRVVDRSILLPFYRRWLVDPFLRFVPASVHPNWITHLGHALNLAAVTLLMGLWPEGGWPFAVAMVLLQAYLWCDHADGAHARRTGQASPRGELLDHGLDQLNTVYIGFLTALALGAAPIWWVAMAVAIPGACVVAYWEQAATGVFHLGRLNQIESVTVLSCALAASALLGTAFFETPLVAGIELGTAFMIWTAVTILFGVARGLVRVTARAPGSVRSILPLLMFAALLLVAVAAGTLDVVAAVVVATAGNVAYGIRMLDCRVRARPPRAPRRMQAALATLSVAIVWTALGSAPPLGLPLAIAACAVFGAQTVRDARRGWAALGDPLVDLPGKG